MGRDKLSFIFLSFGKREEVQMHFHTALRQHNDRFSIIVENQSA